MAGGDRRLQPCAGLGNGIRPGDSDRVETLPVGELLYEPAQVARRQKSSSA
jgi:hypothetical protein